MKQYTRKDFIRLGFVAGAAVLLDACGVTDDKSKKEQTAKTSDEPTDAGAGKAHAVMPEMIRKGDPRYDSLRKGFNKRIDRYPAAIALCSTTEQVAEAVKHAQKNGLAIAVKSGGHSMEGFSCNDGGMVINLSKMKSVDVMDNNNIRVGPGCTLSNLYDVILPHGRLLPAGSCGGVGVGGLALGGGYGIFGRKYGLTCDHLLEATMVDGKGDIHSTKDDAELLWAIRGGGTGNFGIVTELVFTTHEAPPMLQAHYFKARHLTAERAAAILEKWMGLMPLLPDSCFSGYVLNGSTLNILVTNYETPTDKFLAQLKDLAGVVDEFRSSKLRELSQMVRNYYGVGKPLYFRNSSAGFFKSYSDVAPFIGSIFEKIVTTPGMIYQVNTLGGKINDATFEKGSCYPHRAYDFISELQAYWDAPSQDSRLAGITTEILKITQQHGIDRQYVNYCSLEFSEWEHAYYGDNYSRLREIKRKYDPDNIIRHPQSIKA